jgi:hypothetical protein
VKGERGHGGLDISEEGARRGGRASPRTKTWGQGPTTLADSVAQVGDPLQHTPCAELCHRRNRWPILDLSTPLRPCALDLSSISSQSARTRAGSRAPPEGAHRRALKAISRKRFPRTTASFWEPGLPPKVAAVIISLFCSILQVQHSALRNDTFVKVGPHGDAALLPV